MTALIETLKALQNRPVHCTCVRVEGLHTEDCPAYDGSDNQLAAEAIGVFVLILKETGVPKEKILKAMAWALDNL